MRKGPQQLWASSTRCGGRKWRGRRAGRRGDDDARGGPCSGGALSADHGGRGETMEGGRGQHGGGNNDGEESPHGGRALSAYQM